MSAPASYSSPFDFGGVFRNTFGTIARTPLPLLAAALTYCLASALFFLFGLFWVFDQAFTPLQG